MEIDSWKVRWSFSSGPALSSAFPERNGAKSLMNDDFFLEPGVDWDIYVHTSHGKMVCSQA